MGLEPVTYEANLGGVLAQRSQSPGIWGGQGGCPWNGIMDGSVPGIGFYDNFIDCPTFPIIVITTVIAVGKYQMFGTSTNTIVRVKQVNSANIIGGALAVTMDSTTAHSASLALSNSPFLMNGVASTSGKLWFEACIAMSTIGANTTGFFIGLSTPDALTFATAIPFTSNTGLAIANTSTTAAYVGFNLPTNGVGQMKTVYADASVTAFTSVGATDPAPLVANTFTRIGMLYDPSQTGTSSTNPATCAIQFWQDNVLLPTGITSATLTATTNLSALQLGPMISVINGSSGGGVCYVKWWKMAQLFPN